MLSVVCPFDAFPVPCHAATWAISWAEREAAHRLTRRPHWLCSAGTALEGSHFPEPIAKSEAAPLTAERKLKKQDPWQVGPVETRLANPTESALWACHTSLWYAKSTTAMRVAERLAFKIS